MPVIVSCKHCNQSFTVKPYLAKTATYCSRSCKALATRIQIKTNCEVCGSEFEHISSRCNKAKYCSRSCYHKAQHLKGSVIYSCTHCHKEFRGSPSHKRKYCSRACTKKASKLIFKPKYSTVRKMMLRRNLIMTCNRCGYDEHIAILGVHHKDRNRH